MSPTNSGAEVIDVLADTTCCRVTGCVRTARYRFIADPHDDGLRCWQHALTYWPVLRRAVQVALIIGTILLIINHADELLNGQVTDLVVAKIALTYLVPFSVSTYSALAVNRLRGEENARPAG